MSLGQRLLLFSPQDSKASEIVAATADWGCMVTICETLEEFRGRLEGGEYQMVLTQGSKALRKMVSEGDEEGEVLRTPLAEIEKRHILRVLASTNGNKTRAARILGIDTKTLYNKLKSYGSAAAAYQRRKNSQVNQTPVSN